MAAIQVGDKVTTNHPVKYWHGQTAIVVEIKDHQPIDGAVRKDAVAFLDNNQWEFVWNLRKQ